MNIMPVIVMVSILVVIALLLAAADYFLASNKERKIVINGNKDLEVTGDGTLLDHLSINKIFIPSACGGKGTCGHCKVHVQNGGGEVLATEKAYLSPQEIDKGIRLACQLKVKDDIQITLPEELLNIQEYSGKVIEIRDLTYDIKFIRVDLVPPYSMDFKPGQYAQIKVPGYDVFRAYSIASPPSSRDSIDFIIRLVNKGLCTTYIHKALEVGDNIQFTGPYGDFYLKEDSDKEIICIGRSTGMAPMRSILHHLKEKNMPRKVTYLFGNSYKEDVFMLDEFEEMAKQYPNFRFIPALSRPKPSDNWTGEIGRVTELVGRYFGTVEHCEAYLCGPAVMLDEATRVLRNKGMDPGNILYDEF